MTTDSTDVVSSVWQSFAPFLEWVIASNWRPGLFLARRDPAGPYSPENCTFLPGAEAVTHQNPPKVFSKPKILVTAFGETKSLRDWARDKRCQVTKAGLRDRLRNGSHPESAITDPPVSQGYNGSWNHLITAFGEEKSLAAWLRDPRCQVRSDWTIVERIQLGATPEKAISTPSFRWRRRSGSKSTVASDGP